MQEDWDWSVKDLFPGLHNAYSTTLSWATFFMLVAIAVFAYNEKRDAPMYIRMNSHWFRKGCERLFEIMCTMYGLKEASMQLSKLISSWLTNNKWIIGKSDRCLFTRGLLIVGLSTDDELIVNKQKRTEELDNFIL